MNASSCNTHEAATGRIAWREGLTAKLTALVRRLPAWRRQPVSPADGAACDAAAVRALADRYRRSDPGFASDLYAAADRSEQIYEAARIAAAHSN
jgi:hypothetical protein